MKKLKITLAVLAITMTAHAFENAASSVKCDASNSNKCTIDGVGSGTGALIKEDDTEDVG